MTPKTNSPRNYCKPCAQLPEQRIIDLAIASVGRKWMKRNTIYIARPKWLKKRGANIPVFMELANLCLIFKNGELYRAFYSDVMTHVIKKQDYYIQVIN